MKWIKGKVSWFDQLDIFYRRQVDKIEEQE